MQNCDIRMSTELASEVCQSIIDQINTSEEEFTIVAYDNDHTPFQLVFLVLKNIVPLDDEAAYKITHEIHFEGKSIVYKGGKEHCHKIGDALDKIRVEFKIY
jgi:hypothetical protein